MSKKIGVNEPCPCGSGRKYKKCCRDKENDKSDFDTFRRNVLGKPITGQTPDGQTYIFNPLDIYHTDILDELKDNNNFEEISWYAGLCKKQEILKIANIATTDDYLLKIRADSVLDNMRLHRVMMARKNANRELWNFSNQFDEGEFKEYLSALPDGIKLKCSQISKGYVFSNDANGALMRTSVGDLIIVSESLRHFLFFMNLFFVDFGKPIPLSVRVAALRIAIRVMLQNESMDFELDERGRIPPDIKSLNDYYVKEQLQFVIGHEYGHYYYDHLDRNRLCSCALQYTENSKQYNFYTHSQNQEFEADLASVFMPNYPSAMFDSKVNAGLYFFSYLHLYEKVKEQIYPSVIPIRTHPPAIDRLWNLYEKTKHNLKEIEAAHVQDLVDSILDLEKALEKDISCNYDRYDFYGSVYLAEPNSEWRDKELIDRVDY